jgi:hypothetical protein
MQRREIVTYIFNLLILFFILLPQAKADGGIVIYDPDIYEWKLQVMKEQFCAINYENGTQKMLLALNVNLRGEKAVWIFPVPAEPDEIMIDTVRGFPKLEGHDIKMRADERISDAFTLMRLSQVYTFPFIMFTQEFEEIKEVEVHEHIEEMGLTTELITAEDGSKFYSYLADKGLTLPANLESILDEYVGKEYSFVVSWISDIKKFKQESAGYELGYSTINTVCVAISFPTNEIYFPLKPTSVYGDQKIPIIIYVIGHATPELYPEIENSEVNYFVDSHYVVPEELSSFFNGKTIVEGLKYTKIKINTSSKYLTEDLWIKDYTPQNLAVYEFINECGLWCVMFFVMLFALISCLATTLAGMVVFKNKIHRKFALLGLWNFLSLIGFAFAIDRSLDSQNIKVNRILLVFLFSIFFLMLSFVFQIFLQFIF